MLYLNKAAIDYAVAMCASTPRYKVVIAVGGRWGGYYVFSYIMNSVKRSPRMVVSGSTLESIEWQNGSTIRIVPCSNNSRNLRAHLVIVDNNVDEDIVNTVFRRIEILEQIDRIQRPEVFDMNTLANTHDETLWAVVIPSGDEEESETGCETEAIASKSELMEFLGIS